ncbi:LicD family protein [Chitinophaga caseinilytica]|uniref:LicD family protein n=1 Tax=Chitinophaga caseinilytica TaxID=2267521 RepID=A0ABZ2Z861_9BACT
MQKYMLSIQKNNGILVALEKNGQRTIIDRPVEPLIAVDEKYQDEEWGVGLSDFEIEYFRANWQAISHFLLQKEKKWCIIVEDGVAVNCSDDMLEDIASQIPDEVDVFFPFGRKPEEAQLKVHPSIMGYFWGSQIYFISKGGAKKLMQLCPLIRQPFDEELLNLSIDNKLSISYDEIDIFTYNYSLSPSYLARRQVVHNKLFNYPAWTADTKQMARDLLRKTCLEADEAAVKLVLHGGTLLGAIRHDAIMPWDDDIDLGIHHHDIEKLLAQLDKSGTLKHKLIHANFRGNPSIFYKIWDENGINIEGYDYKFPFIDIWLYFEDGKAMYYKEWPSFNPDLYFPLKKTEFEGSDLWMPVNPTGFLDFLFRDWREMIVVYPFCHSKERYAFKPLSYAIQVDELGKLIEY